ncbi:FO synthase [Trichinella spiralis]|uniref:FO synthase n=1 Tax=Trichinella spiralis TaxID=6334 RepID=A0ABR3KAX3_TRISP
MISWTAQGGKRVDLTRMRQFHSAAWRHSLPASLPQVEQDDDYDDDDDDAFHCQLLFNLENKNENEWCRGRVRIGQMVIGRFGQWPSVSSVSCYYYGGV